MASHLSACATHNFQTICNFLPGAESELLFISFIFSPSAGQVPTLAVVIHFDELSTCEIVASLKLTQPGLMNPKTKWEKKKFHLCFSLM